MKTLRKIKFRNKAKEPSSTGWVVSGLGLLATSLGVKMVDKRIGAGILGFGLAHVILGQLDRFRPTIKKNSWY